MPRMIRMSLTDANATLLKINNSLQPQQQKNTLPSGTPLTGPMISRIHNIRPGCGSCGRH